MSEIGEPVLSAAERGYVKRPVWRDMKDAPRDGTRILLGRARFAVKRSVCIGRAIEDGGNGKTWMLETSTYHRETEFMGWMPLPSIYLADTWPKFVGGAA